MYNCIHDGLRATQLSHNSQYTFVFSQNLSSLANKTRVEFFLESSHYQGDLHDKTEEFHTLNYLEQLIGDGLLFHMHLSIPDMAFH